MIRRILPSCALLLLLLAACDSATREGTTELLDVGAASVTCRGVGVQRCLLVRSGASGGYLLFYDAIEGFTHEEGYGYALEVRRTRVPDPPMDGSSFRYTLVRVHARTLSPQAALIRTLREQQESWQAAALEQYVVDVQRECFCGSQLVGPVRIQLTRRLGSMYPAVEYMVASMRYLESGEVVPEPLRLAFPGVDQAFDLARWEIVNASDVQVSFDPSLFYISVLDVDRRSHLSEDQYVLRSTVQPAVMP